MSKFAVIIFPDEEKAYEGTSALRELDSEGSLTLYSMAVIGKNVDDSLFLKDPVEKNLLGTASGALVGGLIGLIGGPVGGAIGLAGGAVLGSAWDLFKYGIGVDFVEEISEHLVVGKTAIVAEISESWTTPLDKRMEDIGGTVLRTWRVDFGDQKIAQSLEGAEADYAELKAEFVEATHEEKAKLEDQLNEAMAKLQLSKDSALERLNSMEKEFEAKVQKLEQQLADASAQAKAKIDQRMDALHSDYKLRTDKLKQAWSLAKEVLTS